MKDNGTNNKNGAPEKGVVDSSTSDDLFVHIIDKIGSRGRYQTIYNLTFLMGLTIAGSMVYMNIFLALNVPEHWCTVPGREKTNFTLDEWRKITLPTSVDNRGLEKFSSCQMYDMDFNETRDWGNWQPTSVNVTDCKNGWSYDETWFKSTIPSMGNWVCSKILYVTNVFVVGRIAEVVGLLLLGQLGDIYGRRFIFYISIILCAVGRLLSIVTTSEYVWFLVFSGLSSLTINSVFQSAHVIALEISREENRSSIYIFHNFGWSIGITIVPLLFWWIRDWELFMWVSSVPTALFLLISHYVIESPRWLINKKRFGDAIKQFEKIARVNGREFEMTEKQLAEMYSSTKQEVTYGMASLFDGWRLARNTCLMGLLRSIIGISYYTIVLFSSAMSGNPFLNFFLQSLAEIPSYFTGKYCGDKFGRRLTNSVSMFISFLACVPIYFLATDARYELLIAGLAAFIKFLNALTYFTASLQGMEMYPTCMRQTGLAFGTILANGSSILSPYLVFLGTTIDIRCPYYILGSMFIIGTIVSLYLPETLHKKLPDTIEEACYFGINDKFFSMPKPSHTNMKSLPLSKIDKSMEKLNQPKYAP